MKRLLFPAALCALALIAACSNLKEPATQAISAAEASLAPVKEAAAKYAPEALQSVESQIASLKDNLAKGDYKAVMASAPTVTSAISGLSDTVAAKTKEIEAALAQAKDQWTSLGGDLPRMIEAIQSRVDILSKSKQLPRNIDKAAFDSARTGLDTLKSGWTEASGAFSSGNVTDAVTKAKAIKDKAAEVMHTLGMTNG
ncbi:MAG: hypothetical protein WDO68_10945 [Gammaproteobacteria bacterium]